MPSVASGLAGGLDLTAFDAAVKEFYHDDRVEKLTITDHAFLGALAKKEDFFGDVQPVPLRYANNPGRSRTFTTAQANATGNKVARFMLTRVKDYAIAIVDGETADATSNDVGAFLDATTTEVDSTFEAMAATMARDLFRDGTGQIATSDGTGGTSAVVTLTNSADIVHFEVGMYIAIWSGNALNVAGTDEGDITAVDRTAGTFTLNVPTNINTDYGSGITLASGDGLLVEGDGSDGGSALDATVKVAGLDAYLPSGTPAALFSLTRTTDRDRFAGNVVDGSSSSVEEALIDGAVPVARHGGKVSHYFMSYERYADVEKALGSKREYSEMRVTAEIAFPALLVHGPRGPIKIVADQDCQHNIAWGLDMRVWDFYSLFKAPRLLARDGNQRLRTSSADGDEWRVGYYGNLRCRAPGRNVRLTLPT